MHLLTKWCFLICIFQWCRNERNGVSNHRRLGCLLKHLFRRRLKKTPKLRVIGLCEGTAPVTAGFPSEMANNAETISIYDVIMRYLLPYWRVRIIMVLTLNDETYVCAPLMVSWTPASYGNANAILPLMLLVLNAPCSSTYVMQHSLWGHYLLEAWMGPTIVRYVCHWIIEYMKFL